jgi:hypothetical protein
VIKVRCHAHNSVSPAPTKCWVPMMDVHMIRDQSRSNIPHVPEMAEQTDTCVSIRAEEKLLREVARQGKVYPSAVGGSLKSNRHNLSIGLKKATLSSAVEIAE